jgi:hypothetical protein
MLDTLPFVLTVYTEESVHKCVQTGVTPVEHDTTQRAFP